MADEPLRVARSPEPVPTKARLDESKIFISFPLVDDSGDFIEEGTVEFNLESGGMDPTLKSRLEAVVKGLVKDAGLI